VDARRGGREESPLAGVLRRSPRRDEATRPERPVERPAETARHGADEPIREWSPAGSRPGPRKRGRPKGGRRSNPDYVQISARIHKDVRFGLERVLAERSEREGRVVEMAEVIENLMRFYIEEGDPWDTSGR
jgi:hypothetical protein